EVRRARPVHAIDPRERMPIQRLTLAGYGAGRLVPHAERLQRDRCEEPPPGGRAHLAGQPPRVVEIAAEPPLPPGHAPFANQKPQLERPEPAPERNNPVAEILHAAVGRRLQVTRV